MQTHSVAKRRVFGHKKEGHCPDCAVAPGENHLGGCDVERCPECGHQRLTCECITDLPDLPWTGKWPGKEEAAALGLWCKWVDGKGWANCSETDAGAIPDLNRLYGECKWDKETRTWTK